jgi:hypothetical protein
MRGKMTRRAIKKALRRAEDALRVERFSEAANIYDDMLRAFEVERPSLLDHAATLYGKVRALHAMGRESEAAALAESAIDILAGKRELVETAA